MSKNITFSSYLIKCRSFYKGDRLQCLILRTFCMLTNFGAWCRVTTWRPIKILGPEAKPVENHWYRSVLVSRSGPSVSPTAALLWFIQCLFVFLFHPKYVTVFSPALHALSVSFFTVLSLVQHNWYQSLPSPPHPHALSLTDSTDSDLELAMVRHQPEGLEQLQAQTKFTRKELQSLYRGFKNVRPFKKHKFVTSEIFLLMLG